MLIVHVTKNGGIERALKELKSKVIKTRQNSHLNDRKEFTKRSVKNREILNKAIYRQKIKSNASTTSYSLLYSGPSNQAFKSFRSLGLILLIVFS